MKKMINKMATFLVAMAMLLSISVTPCSADISDADKGVVAPIFNEWVDDDNRN